jgi:hypothetical protein
MRKSAFASFILLAACASHSGGVRPLQSQDLATAPYQDRITKSLAGSLMDEGGCLLFREDETKAHYLPVWPVGSTYNGNLVIFHEPAKADQRLVIGQEFLMEGQPSEWSKLDAAYYGRFQRQCAAPPFLVSGIRPAN